MFSSTFEKINHELNGKEFILQHTKRGYRCISWHPHYIETCWCNNANTAIEQGDRLIKEFYETCGYGKD